MRIISQASRLGAIGFIIVHLDPSRTSGPSAEELKATMELRRLGDDFAVYLLHQLIIERDLLRQVAG